MLLIDQLHLSHFFPERFLDLPLPAYIANLQNKVFPQQQAKLSKAVRHGLGIVWQTHL